MDELKEMQAQMAMLKQSLSDSRIANHNLIKKVVSQKTSSLNRIVWGEVIISPVCLLIITSFCVAKGISLWFAGIFMIGSLIDVILDFKTMRVSRNLIASGSLMAIKRHLLKQKKQRRIQTAVMTPLVLLWIVCLFFATNKPYALSGTDLTVAWISAALILTVTLVIILWLSRKIDETTDEMVSDIDESAKD